MIKWVVVRKATNLKGLSVLEPLDGRSWVVEHALKNDVFLLSNSLLVVESSREVVQYLLLFHLQLGRTLLVVCLTRVPPCILQSHAMNNQL